MKKILILTITSLFIMSCGNQNQLDDNNDVINTGNVLEQENENVSNNDNDIIDSEIEKFDESLIEDEVAEEIKQITHNNFIPLYENLKGLDKEQLESYDCESYFYLPEPENRPKFQMDIQKEYIQKCEDLK